MRVWSGKTAKLKKGRTWKQIDLTKRPRERLNKSGASWQNEARVLRRLDTMAQDELGIGAANVAAIGQILHVNADGFVTIPEVERLTGSGGPLDMSRIGDRFAYGLSKRGGAMYGRVRAIDDRVAKNAVRPEGSTPVRGSGLRKFGPQVGIGAEVPDDKKLNEQIAKRRELIRTDQKSNYDAMLAHMTATEDPVLKCICNCEVHQLMTGGGYDNVSPVDYYTTIWNFYRRAESLPDLDADTRQMIVAACDSFKEHLKECGFRENSLKPTPFVKVRMDQKQNSKDGTMGWPLLKRSLDKFTQDDANALKSQYDIDLSAMVGEEVDDGYGYVGPARCADAIADLISKYNFDPNNMLPLYVLFQRIQRHGWKDDSMQEPKNGKARAVYVPDVLWGGGVGAMVFDAWQRELERLHVPDFPSLMTPEDQKRTVFEMVANAAANACIVLSADESGYDQSLRADVMVTIVQRCIKPFYEEKYHVLVDIAALSLALKVLIVDQQHFGEVPKSDGDDRLMANAVSRNGHYLLPMSRGGLVSGHKATMSMGSMYGRIVCQRTALALMGMVLPPEIILDGVMAGDDNCMVVLRQWFIDQGINLEDETAVYAALSAVYAKFGIEVNPNKQLWVYTDDEPVTQFLQKIYHSALDIRGIGSASRVLQQVDYSEYPPAHLNVAEQAMAQISVMENGYDNPFINKAVELWISSDPKLLYLFQTFGSEAFNYLTREARMDDPEIVRSILNLETKGANGLRQNASDVTTDINLHIVKIIADVAASLPPSRERWVSPREAGQDKMTNVSDEVIDAGADESITSESEEEV